MTRVLKRPMFRIGGPANEGITSGLAPRQGYALSTTERLREAAGQQPDTSLSQFMIDWGLNMASATPSGSILSTGAEQAKEPFQRFKESKRLEEAYGYKETSEDRALISDLIKGMDEDKLSAMMKKVKAGVAAGYYKDEKEGIIRQLQKEEYGVMDMPGEAENERIRALEVMVSRDQEVPTGMIKAVATHIYKIETDAYPKDIRPDLNKTKTYIKPNHIVGVKRDEDENVIEIVINQNYDKTYTPGQIYFDAQTGDLFKRTSKEGEAIIFTKVIY